MMRDRSSLVLVGVLLLAPASSRAEDRTAVIAKTLPPTAAGPVVEAPAAVGGAAPTAAGPATESYGAASAPDEAEAQRLFGEGRSLMQHQQLEAAAERLQRSQSLSPSVAALLNLGLCERLRGRLATARGYYLQAEALAAHQNDLARRDLASTEATGLESQIPTLTLRVSARPGDPIEIRIDDAPQSREAWGRPIWLDSGEHAVVVRMRGQDVWQEGVQLQDGSRHVLVVPAPRLPAPVLTPELEPAPSSASSPLLTAASSPEDDSRSTASIVALSLGAAGIAAIGVSVVEAILARNAYADSNRGLCNKLDVCQPEGKHLRDSALADAARATAFGIGGGVLLLGGAGLWLLAPRGTPARPLVAASPSSAARPRASLDLSAGPGALQLRLAGSL
jgi:hypothetical protein